MTGLIKEGIFRKACSKLSRLFFICLEAKYHTDKFQVRKLNVWIGGRILFTPCLNMLKLRMTFLFSVFLKERVGGKAVFFIFNTRWHCCFLTVRKTFDLRSRVCRSSA